MGMRKLAECGTWSAYRRHLRYGEPVDDACREAARAQRRAQRKRDAERKAANAQAVEAASGESVKQLVGYGKTVDVEVPTHEDPLVSARWRLKRIRAALLVAGPRDVAPLAKAEQDAITEISRLSQPAEQPEKVSALDQIAAKRAERLAEAAG